jgi:hypothetical protein
VPIIEDPINIYAKGLLEAAQILKNFLEPGGEIPDTQRISRLVFPGRSPFF